MDLRLTKKIALVTGSTAGIGNAIAASLAREGATVIVSGRTPAAVDAAVKSMKAETHGDVLGFAGDLSFASVAESLFQRHPAVDILVNNLGIFEVRPFEEIADADWQRFFDVNVLSGARLARLYLPSMRKLRFTTTGSNVCSSAWIRSRRLSTVSSGRTSTRRWPRIGPWSTSSVTRWTVQPVSVTPLCRAMATASIVPAKSGSSDG